MQAAIGKPFWCHSEVTRGSQFRMRSRGCCGSTQEVPHQQMKKSVVPKCNGLCEYTHIGSTVERPLCWLGKSWFEDCFRKMGVFDKILPDLCRGSCNCSSTVISDVGGNAWPMRWEVSKAWSTLGGPQTKDTARGNWARPYVNRKSASKLNRHTKLLRCTPAHEKKSVFWRSRHSAYKTISNIWNCCRKPRQCLSDLLTLNEF